MIKVIKGNMFDYITENDYIAHCISGDFALGAGIAKEIDKRYNIRSILLNDPFYKRYSDGKGYVIKIDHVFNLVTKEKYWDKPSYTNLEKSLDILAQMLNRHHIDTIHMPKIGCGLDKLSWKIVFPIIIRIFNQYNINGCIYYL